MRSFCSDTEQLKVVFAAVEESILKAAMEDLVSLLLVSTMFSFRRLVRLTCLAGSRVSSKA